ncbi:MAG: sulfatase-like hydrolase/transferase [Mariniblastus sp.]|nr:sulfatase-like hydrolase/transferase [Mariniblastus sp.]
MNKRMKRIRTSLIAVFLSGLSLPAMAGELTCQDTGVSGGSAGSNNEKSADFVDLLAGGDLKEHFETTGNWTLSKEGVAHLQPREGETDWKRYAAYLWLKNEYKDFECEFEYKHEKGGNSGFYFNVTDRQQAVGPVIEVQIIDSAGESKLSAHGICGGILPGITPQANAARPAGQWNKMVVSSLNGEITVKLNGQLVNKAKLTHPRLKTKPQQGHIGFQDHGLPFSLRKIRIRGRAALPSPPSAAKSEKKSRPRKAAAHGPARKTGNPSRPNVILIMTDDQGYGDMSCHGHPWLKTPNLDKLHAESVRLTDYHASPLCSPTRASLLTGRHCRHVGLSGTNNGNNLIAREAATIAHVFAANGYRTGVFGKWHLGDLYPYRPNEKGFLEAIVHGDGAVTTVSDGWGNDYFDDIYWHNGKKTKYKGFCTDVWFDNATSFIKQSKAAKKPFFCYIPTNICHGPLFAPKKHTDMYKGKPHPACFGALAHFDERVGKLRTMLQENGLAENTIFIFCTDNGSHYGWQIFNAGMRAGKGSPYDGGHRVPFFIHWPKGKLNGGRDVTQLSAHMDVLPTLIDLCKLQTPANYKTDGLSLKSVLEGKVDNLGDRVLVESFRGVVMTKQWRLVNRKELYDIQADPGQKKNIAATHPDVVKHLNAELVKVNKKNDTRWQKFIIGSQKQQITEFTPDSWSVHKIGYWQMDILNGVPRTAPIFAEADQAGTYEFSLRRWPEEENKPIRSAIKMTLSSGGGDGVITKAGKALPIVKARLKVAGFDKTIEVTDDMNEAVFRVPLKKGDCDIHAQFIGDDGKEYGAYFLYVEREE